MISGISADSFVASGGSLGRTVRESSIIKDRLDKLTEQSSTGLVAQTYGGLGSVAQVSLDLRPQIERTKVWTQNINSATTRLDVTSSVLDQLHQIGDTFAQGTVGMKVQTSQEVDTLSAQASAALGQVQALLNTKLGQTYLFAGEDTANAPAPDTAFNAYVQSIKTAVSGLAANGGTATAAATLAAANATSPFSTTIGTTPPKVDVGFSQTVTMGIVAGQNAYATSTGPSTTGSYVRDLIRSLATISSLTSSQTSLGQSFDDLVSDTRTSLQGLMQSISNDSGSMGVQKQILTQSQSDLTTTQDALTSQVSTVEDVDIAATAAALSQAQTQLQISYRLISSMQHLSLVDYL